MDRILIEDLEVCFRVGVTEAERGQPQRLLITVELETDIEAAVAADDLTRTIDYSAVARRLVAWGEGKSWCLIETLASEAAGLVRREFGAQRVRVRVKKFAVPGARYVAVEIERP
jgi:dihydroneopterin aldolase